MFHCALLGFATLALVFGAAPSWSTEGAPPQSRRESVLPQSDYSALAKTVGQIILEVPDGTGGTITREICSGLAISDTYILTARHCFYTQTGGLVPYLIARISIGRTQESGSMYDLKHVFAEENAPDDFVVIESERKIEEFSASLLKTSDSFISGSQDLFILHYPGPGSMVLTRMDCRAADPAVVGNSIHHTCDTDPGSSGAPIFDGRFNLVGIHLEGGRNTADANSFNRGTTIAALVGESAIVRSAIQAANNVQKGLQPSLPPEYEYRSTIGTFFIKRGDSWTYRRGNDESSATALVEQDGPGNMWTFWNPYRDVLFQLPTVGGNLRSKAASKDTAYVVIGTVSRTIGPKL